MRLGRLIHGDIHLQWKYGFYSIYLILTPLHVCAIAALLEHWKEDIAAIMIYSDPTTMGLFFIGVIVLLEKNQEVLSATAISPVKVSEYISSKTTVLTAISTVIALILGLVSSSKHLLGVIVRIALTSAVFTVLRIITATRILGLNQSLVAIMPVEIVCSVPPTVGLLIKLLDIPCLFPFATRMNLITGKSSLLLSGMILVFATLIIPCTVARHTVEHI